MGKNEKESMNLKEDLADSCSLFSGFSRKYNEKMLAFF